MIHFRICLGQPPYLNACGLETIYISFKKGSKQVYIHTGIQVRIVDFEDGEILPSCPCYQQYNEILCNTMRKLRQIYEEMLRNNVNVTLNSLKKAYFRNLMNSVTLKDWIDLLMNMSSKKQITKQAYYRLYRYIVEFSNNIDIKVYDLNFFFVSDFITWMSETKKLSKSSIVGLTKCLRHLLIPTII